MKRAIAFAAILAASVSVQAQAPADGQHPCVMFGKTVAERFAASKDLEGAPEKIRQVAGNIARAINAGEVGRPEGILALRALATGYCYGFGDAMQYGGDRI